MDETAPVANLFFGDDISHLCDLIFAHVEASVDHVDGQPIAVLSDVQAAAEAIIAAGYRRPETTP